MYEIPDGELESEIPLKQHLIQNQTMTGDLKDIESVRPMGQHILNDGVKDVVLENCQDQDKGMDINGDSITVRMNQSSLKMLKLSNFGSNFILKHYKKVMDFALITPKLLAVLDKDNVLTLYLKLDQPKTIQVSEPQSQTKTNSTSDNGKKSKKKGKKGSKGQDAKSEDNTDIEKYFDSTNFDTHLHFKPGIPARMISTHPVKPEILAVYDKSDIEVIWLDKESMTEVNKYMVIENKQEVKCIVFNKNSLLTVLNVDGSVNIYNYALDANLKGSFHPYEKAEDVINPSEDTGAKADLTTSIFCPMIEVDYEEDPKFIEFRRKKNLVVNGTLITARYKNSEFTIWDLTPLLKGKGEPMKLHTIDVTGRSKAKKCFLDFKTNTLCMLLRNKSLIFSMATIGKAQNTNVVDKSDPKETLRFKRVYVDLISKKKDNNLPLFVASVHTRNPGNCYTRVVVRQGRKLASYALSIADEFDQARKDVKEFKLIEKESEESDEPVEELTLEVKPEYYNTVSVKV